MATQTIARICSVNNCGRPYCARGFCKSHYNTRYMPQRGMPCDEPNCDRGAQVRGKCGKHYQREMKKKGDSSPLAFHTLDDATLALFWSRVAFTTDTDRCWIWTGTISTSGYGLFYYCGRDRYAHRISWQVANQRDTDLCILHKCDNPPCVNPHHLWAGTHRENNQDRDAKGRTVVTYGEDQGKAKLTNAQVRVIKQDLASGATPIKDLAAQYRVSPSTIYAIRYGDSWSTIG